MPAALFLLSAMAAMCTSNRAITGSLWKSPYQLHEEQYQESPPFTILPLGPKRTYSSLWLARYYEGNEVAAYLAQQTALNRLLTAPARLGVWWRFYFGVLLSLPVLLVGLQRRGLVSDLQLWLLLGLVIGSELYGLKNARVILVTNCLIAAQLALLWYVFDDMWSRLALGTITLVLIENMILKWGFPHYFAPAAGLVLFLQVTALRQLWHRRRESASLPTESQGDFGRGSFGLLPSAVLRGFVVLLPVACALALVVDTVGHSGGLWSGEDGVGSPVPRRDWSLYRAKIQNWLDLQQEPQVVFVRYGPHHRVVDEWVYNHADLIHSHVIWARDLGTGHNRQLLDILKDRTVWLLEADNVQPQLMPYSEAHAFSGSLVPKTVSHRAAHHLPW